MTSSMEVSVQATGNSPFLNEDAAEIIIVRETTTVRIIAKGLIIIRCFMS